MFSTKTLIKLAAVFLATGAAASPADLTARDAASTYAVIRSEDGTWVRSDDMTDAISAATSHLNKRSNGEVQWCKNMDCTECAIAWNGPDSTACVAVPNPNCMILSNFDDAHLETWSSSVCDGGHRVITGCGGTYQIASGGTYSIAVHLNC